MENKSKNELGHIYGSRVSKNGKYLNLIIAATIEGKEIKITCPVTLEVDKKHAYASMIDESGKTARLSVPLFIDIKPQEAKANDDAKTEKPIFAKGDPNDEGLPF